MFGETQYEAVAIPTEGDVEGDMPRRLACGPMNMLVYVREDVVAELVANARQQHAPPDTVALPREVVEQLREVLSGGYMQGANGLAMDRNKVRFALAALEAATAGAERSKG